MKVRLDQKRVTSRAKLFSKSITIRPCVPADFEEIYEVINDAAQAYKGVIPEDRWKEPYMPREELRHEIQEGVVFWGCEEQGRLMGVMGLQPVQDVSLIRHGLNLPEAPVGTNGGNHRQGRCSNLFPMTVESDLRTFPRWEDRRRSPCA